MDIAAHDAQAGAGPSGAVPPVRHEAVLHSSPAELAQLVAPRIASALQEAHTVVVVVDDAHRTALTDVLLDPGPVRFDDPAAVHRVPGFTVAGRLARAGAAGGAALVVCQHLPGLPGCGPTHWARLDIALNVALAGQPVTVLCAYAADADELPWVRTTHPVVTTAGGSARSEQYRRPDDTVVDFPPPPPPDLGPPAVDLHFDASRLAELRDTVDATAADAGLATDQRDDLVLALNELASNSIEHGGGSGQLRMWTEPEIIAEVTDHGGGMDIPFPGIALPSPDGVRGRGLWLAGSLCDVLEVWSDASGTVVRVRMAR